MPRPYIICHMLTSLDGKTTGDFLALPESLPSLAAYETVNAGFQAQASLSGRISMEENFTFFQKPIFDADDTQYPREDYIADSRADAYMVVIDTAGKIAWTSNTLVYQERPPAHIIEIITQKVSDQYLAYLRKYKISYLFAGDETLDLPLALEKLYRLFNIKKLVLSGGGKSNGYFLRENLIDEISLLVAPVLSGDDQAVTLFQGAEPLSAALLASFKLNSVEIINGDCIWQQYKNKAAI